MRLSKIIFFTLQIIALVQSDDPIRWTLHRSCFGTPALRDAMIQAVNTVKTRALTGAKELRNAKYIAVLGMSRSVEKVAKLLLGSANYKSGIDKAAAKFDIYALLQGPIGANQNFAESNEWTQNKHYRDFVIYCAPDLLEQRDEYNNLRIYNNARGQEILGPSNALKVMQDETAAGTAKPGITAVTTKDQWTNVNQQGIPQGDRARVPETITFHPLWLSERSGRSYDLISDQKLQDASAPNAPQVFSEKKATPVDYLLGLEGTLQHEMLHLSAFGSMKDIPEGPGAYGWTNNVKTQNVDNPDVLAFLALVIDLLGGDDKYTVDQNGNVKKK